MEEVTILAGTASAQLAKSVGEILHARMAACSISRFPDGEIAIQLNESVRGCAVFIIQSTCPPVDENLVELLALVDACRRADARRVSAIVPYFGYARADKRRGCREPVTASMVATLMEAVGVDRLITVDLHAPQIEGFFHIPVDNLSAVTLLCDALQARHQLSPDTVVVSPDEGRVKTAAEYGRKLGCPVVVLHKERHGGSTTRVTHVVGDVRDRSCLIIDDMISTGGTIAESIHSLLQAGARPEITIAATHCLRLPGARKNLSHEAVRGILATDTVHVIQNAWPELQVISTAPLLASAISRCG